MPQPCSELWTPDAADPDGPLGQDEGLVSGTKRGHSLVTLDAFCLPPSGAGGPRSNVLTETAGAASSGLGGEVVPKAVGGRFES